ncbi:1-acyl-sn-glycerol-3-phosphate acyltransferase [Gloeomargarita lithophora Alchichica-D10]|uniref:1-acyl-sn-glycerol-3-phosphate acyltransferase n=1 Tax=Gloeomargarita lithophora Alchichica-D10 TaxID=1188229 RepID=A0A1J0A9P5_9CYAN|nr:lysophospholipid acyltransferase family protein [Gloeomargarita lithophora]APB32617.1 1-acyl-sn-glycerol-3-phosphate acyltransferase [Gloeomargarita lithophora Alchichica-D10]
MNNAPRLSPWLTGVAYYLGKYFIFPLYFGRIAITGREQIPKQGALLVTPTHRSRWDAVLVPLSVGWLVSGRHLYFMVAAEEVRGGQGWWIRRLGGFPVQRQKPGRETLTTAIALLSRGDSLVVFPEGKISRDGTLLPLKPGSVHLALQAVQQNPELILHILPIHLQYSHPYQPWRTQVTINIGSPLRVVAPAGQPLRRATLDLTATLHQSLTALGESLHHPP